MNSFLYSSWCCTSLHTFINTTGKKKDRWERVQLRGRVYREDRYDRAYKSSYIMKMNWKGGGNRKLS
jgi:hypothetical protein